VISLLQSHGEREYVRKGKEAQEALQERKHNFVLRKICTTYEGSKLICIDFSIPGIRDTLRFFIKPLLACFNPLVL
jgi:hypothetical protein